MKRLLWILACVTPLGLFQAAPAGAGWIIEQVVRQGAGAPARTGEQQRQVLTISANRMKTVMLDRAGKAANAWIMDLDAQTLTSVDYAQRSVTTGTLQEFAETLRGATAAMGGQMAEAMKQMQDAMKDMPPEQRQQMQQMMQKSMPGGGVPGAAPSAEACRPPRTEVRPTGQTAKIAGYNATRFDVFEDGKLAQEVWVSPTVTAWRELDPKKMERFGQEMTKATEGLPGCGRDRARQAGADPNDPAWKLSTEGYPVRTVFHGQAEGTILEVLKAESRAVPATEFQPPADFKRQSFKDMMGGK
ncbi:MAG TPA: hypothetical protein VEU07_06855 [Candidatus Acidoferrum sp.]|nr:hypothetical protein [Candidatus Acidoferrum sp.]